MAERLRRWLEQRWYEGAPVPWWLRSLSAIFGGVSGFRRFLYRRGLLRTHRLAVPVIVVGNLTVGGSGKTPMVIALVEALRAEGFRPGVISRGYGRTAADPRAPMIVTADTDPAHGGDEPVLIAWRTRAPVAVSRDRVAAGELLLSQHDVDVIVADDGLQHYRLGRDVEIVVVDGRRRFGNSRLLPAGPLREPVSRLRGVDAVVVNGPRGPDEPGFDLQPSNVVPLRGGAPRPLSDLAGTRVHAVAGIGDPERFFATLRTAGVDVVPHPFPDHHAFVAADLDFGDDAPVLMTEKDAMKCRAFAQPHWYALPVTATLPAHVLQRVLARVRR
jgi:tetraacyldisaccharide 4'-kinase